MVINNLSFNSINNILSDIEQFPALQRQLRRRLFSSSLSSKLKYGINILDDARKNGKKVAVYGAGSVARQFLQKYATHKALVGYIPSDMDNLNARLLDDIMPRMTLDCEHDELILGSTFEDEIIDRIANKYPTDKIVTIEKIMTVGCNYQEQLRLSKTLEELSCSDEKWIVFAGENLEMPIYQLIIELSNKYPNIRTAVFICGRNQTNMGFENLVDYYHNLNDLFYNPHNYYFMASILASIPQDISIFSCSGNSIFGAFIRMLKPDCHFHIYDVWTSYGANFSSDRDVVDGLLQAEEYLCGQEGALSHHGHAERVMALLNNGKTKVNNIRCLQGWIIPSECIPLEQQKSKQEKWRVVYAGLVGAVADEANTNHLRVFENILSGDVDLTVYALHSTDIDIAPYEKMAKKNSLFHWKPPISFQKVPSILSQFNFGLIALSAGRTQVSSMHFQCQFSGKFYAYMQAGLPLIVSPNMIYLAELVRKYNLGIVLPVEQMNTLGSVLNEADIYSFKKGIEFVRRKYDISHTIKCLFTKLKIVE